MKQSVIFIRGNYGYTASRLRIPDVFLDLLCLMAVFLEYCNKYITFAS